MNKKSAQSSFDYLTESHRSQSYSCAPSEIQLNSSKYDCPDFNINCGKGSKLAYKTREKLIEVARQLFVRKGLENTTMNDIATASDKGRRTIYTYFKNKKDIYNAVVESESDKMVAELSRIATSELTADEKLKLFLTTRLAQVRYVTSTYSTFKSWLRLDVLRVERVRALVSDKESTILNSILDDGVLSGVFDREKVELLDKFITNCIHGQDLVELSSDVHRQSDEANQALADFIVSGILRNKEIIDN